MPKNNFVVMAACSRNSRSLEMLVDMRREEEQVQRSVVSSWMWVIVSVFVVIEHVYAPA